MKLGQRTSDLIWDERTLFGLHLKGLFPKDEQERLRDTDRDEFNRRIHEACTLGLDQYIEGAVAMWLGPRPAKKALLVTPRPSNPSHTC